MLEPSPVLLAMGVYQPRILSAPGRGPDSTVEALQYLTHQNRRDLGDAEQAVRRYLGGPR